MWKKLFDALLNAYQLVQRVEKLERELKDSRQEQKELAALVQQMSQAQKYAKERELADRKMLLLEIENRILKAHFQLPSARQIEAVKDDPQPSTAPDHDLE